MVYKIWTQVWFQGLCSYALDRGTGIAIMPYIANHLFSFYHINSNSQELLRHDLISKRGGVQDEGMTPEGNVSSVTQLLVLEWKRSTSFASAHQQITSASIIRITDCWQICYCLVSGGVLQVRQETFFNGSLFVALSSCGFVTAIKTTKFVKQLSFD